MAVDSDIKKKNINGAIEAYSEDTITEKTPSLNNPY